MLNSNLAIKKIYKIGFVVLYPILCSILINCFAIAQTNPTPLPQVLQFLSVNAKALENNLEFTIDENTPALIQLNLTKSGNILHLRPKENLKTDTKIKMLSQDLEEAELFILNDNTLFALVDPEKTYFILQETTPDCNELINIFESQEENTICPDKISLRLANNITVTQDSSIEITPESIFKFFSLPLNIPEGLDNKKSLTLIETKNLNPETGLSIEQILPETINIGNLLKTSTICIKSRTTSKKFEPSSNCSFDDETIQSIITFSNNFKEKENLLGNLNLVFPFLKKSFNKLIHEYTLEVNQIIDPKNNELVIDNNISNVLNFDGSNLTIGFNLGEISKSKTKINNMTFNLNEPIFLNKELDKVTFQIPKDKFESVLNPFADQTITSTITEININGKTKDNKNTFSINLPNNIFLKNEEPEEIDTKETETPQRLQFNEENNEQLINISTYLPQDTFDTNLSRIYTHIEQSIAPGVDDTGNTINIVNDKSKLDISLLNNFPQIDTSLKNILFDIKKASGLLEKDTLFNNQTTLSGFLLPPDFQPVVIEGYRATVQFTRAFELEKDLILDFNYQELKTKDEVPFTNAFNFAFIPFGTYNVKVRFNGERESLFATNGVILKDNLND